MRQRHIATPEQIARFGHVAAILREKLEEHQLKPYHLKVKLGLHESDSRVYLWLQSMRRMAVDDREKVSKILSIDPERLKEKELVKAKTTKAEKLPVVVKASAPKVVKLEPKPIKRPDPKNTTTFEFIRQPDGNVRLKVEVTTTLDQALAIATCLKE